MTSDLNYPKWLDRLVPWDKAFEPEGCMSLANHLALLNVEHHGGPFAAVLADQNGVIHAVGTNRVVDKNDSTAHAEVLAIRRAQKKFRTFDLSLTEKSPLILYSSCEPCIMCFGVIWWAKLHAVYSSATKQDAEAVGFSEGPINTALWDELVREKHTVYVTQFCRDTDALKPFALFKSKGHLY